MYHFKPIKTKSQPPGPQNPPLRQSGSGGASLRNRIGSKAPEWEEAEFGPNITESWGLILNEAVKRAVKKTGLKMKRDRRENIWILGSS
jgi:hypothetical protein